MSVKSKNKGLLANKRLAETIWGPLEKRELDGMRQLLKRHGLSLALGDLQYFDGRWYVTHAGLLRIALRRRCKGIVTDIQTELSNPTFGRWVFKATVFKRSHSRGFVGYGDADPSNVSPLVHGAEMRVAETRAVIEELGSFSSPAEPARDKQNGTRPSNGNGSSNGQLRLRDRLCLLIRQHHLDSNLVKRYAAEFCGTEELREASRDMVEAFIDHLAKCALEDRDALLAKLNSFSDPQEVHQ